MISPERFVGGLLGSARGLSGRPWEASGRPLGGLWEAPGRPGPPDPPRIHPEKNHFNHLVLGNDFKSSTGAEENSSRYLASRGCYSTPGCRKAGEHAGSTCAIDVEVHKRRPPSKVGGLCHESRV